MMKNSNLIQNDIDSIDILNVIRRGKLIIASSIIITLAAAFFATKVFVKPIYEVSTKILVREEKLNPKDEFPSYETGWQFANSQAEIIKSRSVIDKALQKIDFSKEEFKGLDPNSLNKSMLQKKISLTLLEGTNVLELQVQQPNPLFASMLANAIAETYIENRVKLKSETVERIISALEKRSKRQKRILTLLRRS